MNLGRGAVQQHVHAGGYTPGAPLPRSARIGHFPQCDRCAVLPQGAGLRLYGKTQSGVAPRLEAEEHVGCGTIVDVPLPDIPVGQSEVGVVSVYNRSAATVTQAGGDECALPAFFAQAPAGKRAGTEEPASGEALRVSETLGGVLGPVGGF